MEPKEIENRFNYHQPKTEDVKSAHEAVRSLFKDCTIDLLDFVPDCRERSLALTKIEEAMMWANAAIARNQEK